MAFEIQFLGGAGTVTGSKYLITTNQKKILVDCGLFQGLKNLRLKNWEKFPVPPSEIDYILLTHAHIDHSGYIPRLIKEGFRGRIFCSTATFDVCKILLPDCGYILEEEANYLNKIKKTKHAPALPLFSEKEAEASLKYFDCVAFNEEQKLTEKISFELRYSGHILGASSIVLSIEETRIAFTGDVGRWEDRLFKSPQLLPKIDYLVTESTYGDRLHSQVDILIELADSINQAVQRNGVVVIPAFAVGRAQTLMLLLTQLIKEKRIPSIPIFLNSPMATSFSDVFNRYPQLHKITPQECSEVDDRIYFVRTADESRALNKEDGPMILISASGMATGGRVLHHLKAFAPDPKNMILLCGYQAAGTRGEALQNGAPEIKIHGEYIPVRAQVVTLENISAHADYNEMIHWFTESKISPKTVFITHGEPAAADHFSRKLTEKLNWNCVIPEDGQKVQLS